MILPLRDNAPKGSEPVVTISLLGVCILIFGLQLAFPGGFERSLEVWGEVPTRILAGEKVPGTNISAYWTWLSAMFMHGDFWHLFGNLLMLWLFGDNVEWLMGRLRFLFFFVTVGVLANVVTTYLGYQSDMPGIGASGAIAGVMALYLVFYPRARVTSVMWISPFGFWHWGTGEWGFVTRNISALWFIGGWLVWELAFSGLLLGSGAHFNAGTYAHVSGALAGALLGWPLVIQSRRPERDHDAVSGELSAAIWGDAGDGGEGELIITPQETSAERLARLPAEDVAAWIRDYHAEDLIRAGQGDAALAHCREMLAMAQRLGEFDRVEGYNILLDKLQRQPQAVDMSVGI